MNALDMHYAEPALAGLVSPYKPKPLKYDGQSVRLVVPSSPASTHAPSTPTAAVWLAGAAWTTADPGAYLTEMTEQQQELVSQAEQRSEALEARVSRLQQELCTDLPAYECQLEERYAAQSKSLKFEKQRSELLKEHVVRLKAEAEHHTCDLEKAEERSMVLENYVTSLREEVDAESARHAKYLAEVREQHRQALELERQRSESLQAWKARFEGEAAWHLGESRKFKALAHELGEQYAVLENRFPGLQHEIHAASANHTEHAAQIDARHKEPLTLAKQYSESLEARATHFEKQLLLTSSAHVSDFHHERASHAKELRAMREQVDLARIRTMRLEEALAASQKRVGDLEKEQMGTSHMHIVHLEEALVASGNRVHDLELECRSHVRNLQEPKKRSDLLESRNDELERRLAMAGACHQSREPRQETAYRKRIQDESCQEASRSIAVPIKVSLRPALRPPPPPPHASPRRRPALGSTIFEREKPRSQQSAEPHRPNTGHQRVAAGIQHVNCGAASELLVVSAVAALDSADRTGKTDRYDQHGKLTLYDSKGRAV
eukprot:TRINITY_DN29484_c0_g1_i1.p1 TRINITY_DN29484_c0_g1~~TRINITY_DN29484_c0_g1_i1.p1  ORF type:complete len:551 (+),score=103.18 TRINITY_DN29484_c0_g1_i1:105-1757(+)